MEMSVAADDGLNQPDEPGGHLEEATEHLSHREVVVGGTALAALARVKAGASALTPITTVIGSAARAHLNVLGIQLTLAPNPRSSLLDVWRGQMGLINDTQMNPIATKPLLSRLMAKSRTQRFSSAHMSFSTKNQSAEMLPYPEATS